MALPLLLLPVLLLPVLLPLGLRLPDPVLLELLVLVPVLPEVVILYPSFSASCLICSARFWVSGCEENISVKVPCCPVSPPILRSTFSAWYMAKGSTPLATQKR